MLHQIRDIISISLYSVFTLLPLYILTYLIRFYYKRLRYSQIPGPKTVGVQGFFLGNLKEILTKVSTGKTYPEYLFECFKEYGPVFKIQILDRIIVHTIEAEAVRDGLVVKNYSKVPKFCKAISFPLNSRFLGNGLLTEASNEIAKNRRALYWEFFQKQSLIRNFALLNEKADSLINRLNILADSEVYFEFKTEISHLILDIIAKFAFSMELNSLTNSENDFNKSIRFVLQGLIEQIKDPLLCYKPTKWAYIRKFKESIEFLRNTGRDVIQKRQSLMQTNENIPNDLLTVIIENRKNNVELMIDDFVTFFVAGQETTSVAASFIVLELGKNKSVYDKLKLEITQKIGNRKHISYDDITSLTYAEHVLKETLRLWPPVPSITRLMPEKRLINNYLIPKNTEVSFSVFSAGRNEKNFKNPTEFQPERLQNTTNCGNQITSYAYFPFSLGSRGCIAQHFAKIEVKLIIAKIIQNFDFEIDPEQSFDCVYTGNLAPKSGVRCKIRKNAIQ